MYPIRQIFGINCSHGRLLTRREGLEELEKQGADRESDHRIYELDDSDGPYVAIYERHLG